jgi:hypothetical protein
MRENWADLKRWIGFAHVGRLRVELLLGGGGRSPKEGAISTAAIRWRASSFILWVDNLKEIVDARTCQPY